MAKELSEMTLKELWQLFPVVLKEYNDAYPDWYEIEKRRLIDLIGEGDIFRINHIGSSAVKGMLAKPTVDILLELNEEIDLNEISHKISNRGWILMSSQEKPYKSRVFNKGYTKQGFAEKVYHLHVRYAGDWNELYFRDYLNDSKEAAEKYAVLKLELIKKFRDDRDGYTDAKSDFILYCTEHARKKYGGRYKVK
ncbi:MAG: GrpB family protein [Candidatus Delongbacteria bacterium]